MLGRHRSVGRKHFCIKNGDWGVTARTHRRAFWTRGPLH